MADVSTCVEAPSVLILEAFYGESHRYLVDFLTALLGERAIVCKLAPKKFHWRARTSGLELALQLPADLSFEVLFASSVVSLADLLAVRPQLQGAKKVLYFHENQLAYPVQEPKERDFQYGYNQIVSCLAADVVLFNSAYNLTSFTSRIATHLRRIPYFNGADDVVERVRGKCRVLSLPVALPSPLPRVADHETAHIVWAHRWEYDKNPELFFRVLFELDEQGFRFRVSVLGEGYGEQPPIFAEARARLPDPCVANWGFLDSKEAYFDVLRSAHVAVSTANHEFFGIAMLEATAAGCFPLCPNRLVYPEIYPEECLYNTEAQLAKALRAFCKHPQLARQKRAKLQEMFEAKFEQFSARADGELVRRYRDLFGNKVEQNVVPTVSGIDV